MKSLIVYGTLKRGEALHTLLSNSTFIGNVEVKGFILFLFKKGNYPVAVYTGEEDVICGELYEVPEPDFQVIRMLECNSGYNLAMVDGKHIFHMLPTKVYDEIYQYELIKDGKYRGVSHD